MTHKLPTPERGIFVTVGLDPASGTVVTRYSRRGKCAARRLLPEGSKLLRHLERVAESIAEVDAHESLIEDLPDALLI